MRTHSLVLLGVLASSAPPGSKRIPDMVPIDDDCLFTGAAVGAKALMSKAESPRMSLCYRREKGTFDCTMTFLSGEKFDDGKRTTPIVFRASTLAESPKMILATLESSDMVFLDWSIGRYVWAMTKISPADGYLFQHQCVGTVATGAAVERYLRSSGPN